MPPKGPSLNSGSSTNERLEPRLLRAVEANDLEKVTETIQEAQAISNINPHFLDIGLARACDRNLVDAVKLLLSRGADANYAAGNKLVPLRRTAESGSVEIVKTLLDHGANREACDKKGRTALMTAAWRNHFPIVKILLERGANMHTTDLRGRNVLHNIAADKGKRRCSMEIVEFLLQAGINLDAKDELGRTAIHWSCVTDHEELLRRLLAPSGTSNTSGGRVNSMDSRMKTPLHLAVSHHREHLVKVLIESKANVMARSDGAWTALHNACINGPSSLINLLLQFGANVNAELLNGRTPLHVAAEHGNVDAANCLLKQPNVRRAVKDRFGNTPLLIAAQHKQKTIAEILAPWNHLDSLSLDEIEAAKKFNAAIVDFGNFKNENKVTRVSVYDLLYARDPQQSSQHLISTLVQNVKATNFRWIHLPANNVAWCETLLMKRFIEEDARDVEGYKALEASFTHQHRGQQHHARFMRPMCQTINRAQAEEKQPETPAVVVHEADTSLLETPEKMVTSPEPTVSSGTSTPRGNEQRGLAKSLPKFPTTPKQNKPKQNAAPTRRQDQSGFVRNAPPRRQSRNSDKSAISPSRRGFSNPNSIYFFMPYLHFETDENRRAMRQAMEQPNQLRSMTGLSRDEVLVRAHLAASSSFLHVRRTLDQFFYHNIDTNLRDSDQVVYKFQKQHGMPVDRDPKIFMVDQLWMWIIGKDVVVTSFPERWKQPRNDPLNVLEGIIEDINSKTREPIQNVFELAMTIAGRCFGTFDRHRKGDEEFQFLDMFEASIGNAMDREAKLFRQFSEASRQASMWLKERSQPSKLAKRSKAASKVESHLSADSRPLGKRDTFQDPLFVDRLLDVGPETDLLSEIKDIREELDIIRMVLGHQEHLFPELKDAIKSICRDERGWRELLKKLDRKFEEQEKTIINPLKDIDRMDKQAERIYGSIRDLLDLKQKHANAFEARFARDQAQGTVRQGRTIMVFTVVTVIFLPLSFIAAFFAINVEEYPHRPGGQVELPLSFVSEYTFGIGLAISIPLILIALSVDELSSGYGKVRDWFRTQWFKISQHDENQQDLVEKEDIIIEESVSKALRKSAEASWNGRLAPPARQDTGMSADVRTSMGRASRPSWDVERGFRFSQE